MSGKLPRVVVVGSVNADVLLDVERLPGPGETLTATGSAAAWGGKGANQAVAAARLGASAALVGAVGRDERGRGALADLDRCGVETSWVRRVSLPTGSAHVVRDHEGENLIIVVPGANHAVTAEHVRTAITAMADDDAVVVASCEVPDEAVLAAAQASAERGWRFVLNPAPARPLAADLLAHVAVLTPNAEEVTRLGVASIDDLLDLGVGAVVVTRGGDGVDIHQPGHTEHVDAFEVAVVDTVGAGDAFTAALAVALAAGEALEVAVRFAAAAGAVAVTGAGARGGAMGLPSVRELLDQCPADTNPRGH